MPLTPGERIDLIKKVAQTLGQQDWDDIDLTLSQFGFQVSEHWSGTPEGYARAMVQDADDDRLLQLDAYLHPTEGPEAPPQQDAFDDPASPWTGEGFRLFISHVHPEAKAAGALREALASRSIDAFVAHDSIPAGEEWERVILRALRTCDACLAFLTDGFKESDWTDQEIGFCIARKRLVIPLEHGLMPYGFLGRYQALRVRGRDPAAVALDVFDLLVRHEDTRDRMARALVDRWANTPSYNAARENYGFLKIIPAEAWTQPLVNEVWEACKRNSQLGDANINYVSVEDALRTLFADTRFGPPPTVASTSDDDIPF